MRFFLLLASVFIGCHHPKPEVAASVRVQRSDGSLGFVRAASPSAYGHYLQAAVLEEQGLLPEALEELSQALAFDSKDAHLNYRVAFLLWRLGDLEQAESFCKAALRIDHKKPEANLLWARLSEARGQAIAAKSAYQRAIEAAPRYEEAYAAYGSFLLALDEPEQAEALFARLERELPSSPVGALLLARDAEEHGQRSRAMRFYALALQKDKANREAALALGALYQHEGQEERAVELYTAALAVLGNDLLVLVALQELARQRGDRELFEDCAQRLELLPGYQANNPTIEKAPQ